MLRIGEVVIRALYPLVIGALALGAGHAAADDVGDPVKGRAFAREVCGVCHAVEPEPATSPHPAAPTFARIAAEPGMTATALFVILRNPHREMPDLILPKAEMSDVIAYILTLDTDR